MIHHTFDLLRATEVAAIAASEWVGRGDKLSADKAATEAMRERLNRVDFSAKVLIGEGKKDESFGLFEGEFVGSRDKALDEKHYELCVDPIDGTRPTVNSGPEALSVIGIAEEGSLFTTEEFYMHKIGYGPKIAAKTDLKLSEPLEKIIKKVCKATGKQAGQVMVCLLDRPRHAEHIERLRKLGVRTKLIQDCDISGAIATCLTESGIDLLYGIGGSPEAVLAACAMKCLRGNFKAQLANGEGKILDTREYGIEDLVKGNCAFAATGITDGSLLKGVRYTGKGAITHGVVMRSETGTVRWMEAFHESREKKV